METVRQIVETEPRALRTVKPAVPRDLNDVRFVQSAAQTVVHSQRHYSPYSTPGLQEKQIQCVSS